MPAPQADQLVEVIFDRFMLVYGMGQMERMFAGQNPAEVRLFWAEQLRAFEPSDIAYGLRLLPADWMPNVLQFRALCSRAPMPAQWTLAEPKADGPRVAALSSQCKDALKGGQPSTRAEWVVYWQARLDHPSAYTRKCAEDVLRRWGLLAEPAQPGNA